MGKDAVVKGLNKVAFIVLLAGACAGLAYAIYELVVTIRVFALGIQLANLAIFNEIFEAAGMPNVVDIFFKVMYGLVIFAFSIYILIDLIFILRLLKNSKSEMEQDYMNSPIRIAIFGIIYTAMSVSSGEYLAIFGLIFNIAILVGICMQKFMPENKAA